MIGNSDRIIVYSPKIDNTSRNTFDSESLYLGQYFFNYGYDVQRVDCYSNPYLKIEQTISKIKNNIIIVHLWKNELLRKKGLERLLLELHNIKNHSLVKEIICVGSLAVLLAKEIFEYNTSIDTIVGQSRIYTNPFCKGSDLTLSKFVQAYFQKDIFLTDKYLQKYLKITKNNVASIFTSRGCNNNCSFCSYNGNIDKLFQRKMAFVINDITNIVDIFDTKYIAISDSNFGYNTAIIKKKALFLYNKLKDRKKQINLSLNISLNYLSEEILEILSEAQVKTILIGLESFNANTRNNIYGKKIDIGNLNKILESLYKLSITPIFSYILFQPWLTYDNLKEEIRMIEDFGRHQIAQFMTNSILQIIPNTMIEKEIFISKLLIKSSHFGRTFYFVDDKVERIYKELSSFYNENIVNYNYDNNSIAKFKKIEWDYLKKIC